MRLYPQKQTLAVLLVCVAVVAGVALYVFDGKNYSQKGRSAETSIATVQTSATPSPLIDPSDWKSSFGDIGSSTNSFVTPKSQPKNTAELAKTPTDRFAQDVFAQYVILKQTGTSDDQTILSSAMSKVAEQAAAALQGPIAYTINELNVVADNSASRTTYATILKAASSAYSTRVDEAEVAAQAFESGDTSKLSALDKVSASYRTMLSTLISAPVPKNVVGYHLNLVNAISALLFSTNSFRHMDTDPITGYAAIKLDAIATIAADNMFQAIAQSLSITHI